MISLLVSDFGSVWRECSVHSCSCPCLIPPEAEICPFMYVQLNIILFRSHLSETNCKVFSSFNGVELEVEVSAIIIRQNKLVHIFRGIEIEWNKEKKILWQDGLKVLLIKSLGGLFFMKQNLIFGLVMAGLGGLAV